MTRDDARQESEVVVDNAWQNRLRSDVDQPGPRLTQQKKKEQIAFFIRLHDCTRARQFDGHRWHYNNRLRILIESFDRFPQRHELLLQPIELLL